MARGGNVNIVVDAQTAGLIQGWLQARNNLQNYQQQLGQVGQVGQRAGQQAGGAFANFGREIGRAGLAMAGLSTVTQSASTFMQLLRSEYEALQASRLESAGVKKEAAVAIAEAATSFNATKQFGVDQMIDLGKVLAKDANLSRAVYFGALKEVFAQGGTISPRDSMQAAVAASQMDPSIMLGGKTEDLASSTMASMLVMRKFNKTAKQAAGANLRFFRSAFVKDPDSFSKQVVPSLELLDEMATGEGKDDLKFLMSFMSGITQGAVDTTGRSSRTLAATVTSNLKAFTLSRGFRGTLQEQIAYVSENEDMRKEFVGVLSDALGEAGGILEQDQAAALLAEIDPGRRGKLKAAGEMGGEARLRTVAAQIFDPNSPLWDQIRAAESKLGNIDTAFEEELPKFQRMLQRPEFTEKVVQIAQQVSNEQGGDRTQVTRDYVVSELIKMRRSLGIGPIQDFFKFNVGAGKLSAMMADKVTKDEIIQAAIDNATEIKEADRRVREQTFGPGGFDDPNRPKDFREQATFTREQVQQIDKFISRLESLKQDGPQKVEIVNPPVQQAPGALPDGGL